MITVNLDYLNTHQVNERVLSRHMIDEAKRAWVRPSKVDNLLKCYWDKGVVVTPLADMEECRDNVKNTLANIRKDHCRGLNPTPYKVSVTNGLYGFMHELWMKCAPISELA